MKDKEKAEVAFSYPSPFGYATFLKCNTKSFVIYMDKSGGSAIDRAINKIQGERPMTHELICFLLEGTETKLQEVLIYKEDEGTFYAKMTLKMQNELGEKILYVDSRPSDALTIAIRQNADIYVSKSVLEKVEDASLIMEEIQKKNFQ